MFDYQPKKIILLFILKVFNSCAFLFSTKRQYEIRTIQAFVTRNEKKKVEYGGIYLKLIELSLNSNNQIKYQNVLFDRYYFIIY